jgi:hypothetical protein
VTAYESGGALEAYLFDAAASSEAIACVSCRSDGQESFAAGGEGSDVTRLPYATGFTAAGSSPHEPLALPTSLTVQNGSPSVFFMSFDPLAPGGVEGSMGLYEWSHGQVSLIDQEPADLTARKSQTPFNVFPRGASADGTDFYFTTPQRLVPWEDGDERSSVYDARVGGGFPEPPPGATPCQADAESSCQGAPATPPATPGPTSNGFTGPGNPKPKRCKKGQVARHGKCVKKKAKHKKHKQKHGSNQKKKHGKGKRGAGK